MSIRLFFAFFFVSFSAVAHAQTAGEITPSERVQSYVVVREGPSTTTSPIDKLHPGENLPVVGEVPGWYQVALADGRTGYVSKAWTVASAATVGRFRVHAIDVGTGLATFVEGPDFTLLYDAGSNDDTRGGVNNRVVAYLRAIRPDLRVIDHVILSHAHKDHLHLLPDVFDAYKVRNVWDSGRLYDSCDYRKFLLKVRDEQGIVFHAAVGDNTATSYTFNCAQQPKTITIPLGPRLTPSTVRLGRYAQMTFFHVDTQLHADPNENSLVVLLELAHRRILLMGDAEGGERNEPQSAPAPGSVEAKLLACCRAALAADVLFVGHHGSKTSSRTALLDAVGATNFIVSSGPYEYSGTTLPDVAVVQELSRRGNVWRTDRDDRACAVNPQKIGQDADNKSGGCDNILIEVTQAGVVSVNYNMIAD